MHSRGTSSAVAAGVAPQPLSLRQRTGKAPMRGSPQDRVPAASVASMRAVIEGRRPKGATGYTSDAGTVGGAANEAGATAAATVAHPTGTKRTRVA